MRIFTIILLSILFISCEEPDYQAQSQNTTEVEQEIKYDTVCYPGFDGHFKTCFSTLEIDSLNSEAEDYVYSNPLSDSTFPVGLNSNQYIAPDKIIDLRGLEPEVRLAKYFKLKRLMSITKGSFGLFSPVIIEILNQLREELNVPIIVNSGYRSPGYNQGIGGAAKWSRHMYGDAFDVTSSKVSRYDIQSTCENLGASFTLVYRNHVHCDWRNSPLHEGFYPPVIQPSRLMPTALAYSLSSNIISHVDNGVLTLTVTHPIEEDPGELEYNWVLQWPDKSVDNYNSKIIEVPVKFDSLYVEVLIGGSILVTKTIAN